MPRRWIIAFVCTGNSCRSLMAEALLRAAAPAHIEAVSAGTRPAGFAHPLALQTLENMGVPTAGLESKPVEALRDRRVDILITVCDNASAECPSGLAALASAHWGLPDPTFHPGTAADRLAFSGEIADRLRNRVERLVALPLERLSPEQIQKYLDRLAVL